MFRHVAFATRNRRLRLDTFADRVQTPDCYSAACGTLVWNEIWTILVRYIPGAKCTLYRPGWRIRLYILEPGMGQFREFETPPSAYSYDFVGTFSCAQIVLRKARERELATLDEKSTSSGIAEPYAR